MHCTESNGNLLDMRGEPIVISLKWASFGIGPPLTMNLSLLDTWQLSSNAYQVKLLKRSLLQFLTSSLPFNKTQPMTSVPILSSRWSSSPRHLLPYVLCHSSESSSPQIFFKLTKKKTN